jgi:hypothetical protein
MTPWLKDQISNYSIVATDKFPVKEDFFIEKFSSEEFSDINIKFWNLKPH